MRKIIQLSTSTITNVGVVVHAVCDDGTFWEFKEWGGSSWRQLKSIPQPGSEVSQESEKRDNG